MQVSYMNATWGNFSMWVIEGQVGLFSSLPNRKLEMWICIPRKNYIMSSVMDGIRLFYSSCICGSQSNAWPTCNAPCLLNGWNNLLE